MHRTRESLQLQPFDVAIIGGGFTGASLASCLLRQSESLSVALIDPGPHFAHGVAYGTRDSAHLLNVPAYNMSALADDPGHFLRWARINHNSAVQAGDFLPRQLYGRYLESLLEESENLHRDRLFRFRDEAVGINRNAAITKISLRSGQTISADKVVLALGNFPTGDLRLPGDQQRSLFVSNPWAPDALDGIPQDATVLLVGSGLTSVDMVLALREREFRGTIHLLSRHGLLPQSHLEEESFWPAFWNRDFPRTALGLARLIRKEMQAAGAQGRDWREVVDSLRSSTQAIWQSLSLAEQRRFLRHVRAFWDVHRHRVAPQIGRILEQQRLSGAVQSHAGKIMEYRESDGRADVTYRDRTSGALRHLHVDRVINCTGPQADCRKLPSPLLADLIRQSLARPDSLFLGLDTAVDGALIEASGIASDFLFTAGPARKGSLWESIAVPELRIQIAELTSLLLASARAHRDTAETRAIPNYLSATR